MKSGAETRVPLYPILAVNFVGALGFSIVVPILVFLVTRWGGNALVYGIMGATYSAFQLVGAPLLGRWSDVYGRRKILLLSQIGTLLSWLILLWAFFLPTDPLFDVETPLLGSFCITLPLIALFIGRAADGITGGNISVANAYLADVTTDSDRSVNFGKLAVSTNLGFILGPALAGLLAGLGGEIGPVVAAIAISVAATFMIAFGLPESRPCVLSHELENGTVRKTFGQEHKPCYKTTAKRLSIRDLFRIRRVPTLLAIYFLVMLGFSFYYIAFPVHAKDTLGWSVTETGVYFSVMAVLLVIVQGPVLKRVSKKASDLTLILGGSVFLATAFVMFDSARLTSIYAGVVLLAVGNGILWPSVLSMMSKAAGKTHQGAVQGVAGSVGAVASIVGLTGAGLLYWSIGGKVFWGAAAAIVVALLFAVTLVARPVTTSS